MVVTKYYEEILQTVERVLCGDREWQLGYCKHNKTLTGFLPIVREYAVTAADTIFFSVTPGGESSVKIFQNDGMEIKYTDFVVGKEIAPEARYSREKERDIEVIG